MQTYIIFTLTNLIYSDIFSLTNKFAFANIFVLINIIPKLSLLIKELNLGGTFYESKIQT